MKVAIECIYTGDRTQTHHHSDVKRVGGCRIDGLGGLLVSMGDGGSSYYSPGFWLRYVLSLESAS